MEREEISHPRGTSSNAPDDTAQAGTSGVNAEALDLSAIAEDNAQPGTSKDSEDLQRGTHEAELISELAQLIPLDLIGDTSGSSENSHLKSKEEWLAAQNKIIDLYQFIQDGIWTITEVFSWLGRSRRIIDCYELQSYTGVLLSYASSLNYKLEHLIQESVKVPFSKVIFISEKNTVIAHCKVIETLVDEVDSELKRLQELYREVNRGYSIHDDIVVKAAQDYLESVRHKAYSVIICLEELMFPEGSPRKRLNLPLNVQPERRDQENPRSENKCAIDWKWIILGFCVLAICVVIGVVIHAFS